MQCDDIEHNHSTITQSNHHVKYSCGSNWRALRPDKRIANQRCLPSETITLSMADSDRHAPVVMGFLENKQFFTLLHHTSNSITVCNIGTSFTQTPRLVRQRHSVLARLDTHTLKRLLVWY